MRFCCGGIDPDAYLIRTAVRATALADRPGPGCGVVVLVPAVGAELSHNPISPAVNGHQEIRAGGHQFPRLVAACSPGGEGRWPAGSPPCRRGPRRAGADE